MSKPEELWVVFTDKGSISVVMTTEPANIFNDTEKQRYFSETLLTDPEWLAKHNLIQKPEPDKVLEPFLKEAFDRYMKEKEYIKKPEKCGICKDTGKEVIGWGESKPCPCRDNPQSMYSFLKESNGV